LTIKSELNPVFIKNSGFNKIHIKIEILWKKFGRWAEIPVFIIFYSIISIAHKFIHRISFLYEFYQIWFWSGFLFLKPASIRIQFISRTSTQRCFFRINKYTRATKNLFIEILLSQFMLEKFSFLKNSINAKISCLLFFNTFEQSKGTFRLFLDNWKDLIFVQCLGTCI